MKQITNNYGRWIAIDHETGANGVVRIKSVRTNDGRQATFNYAGWTSQGTSVLTGVTYPDGTQAAYAYVGAENVSGAGRPMLATANDPMVKVGSTIAMKYNYDAKFDYGSGPYLVTGTAMEQSNLRSGGLMVSLPGGGGAHPLIVKGDGAKVDRKFTNGLASSRTDGAGRTTNYSRGSGGFGFITSKTRANGAVTAYVRNAVGQITQRTNPLGGISKKAYDSAGFITSKTDELNHAISVARTLSASGNHQPTRITYADGSYKAFTYNSNGQLASKRTREGGTTTYTYNNGSQAGGSLGDLMSVTDALGKVSYYEHNAQGLCTAITDRNNNKTLYTYDARGQKVKEQHPDGSTHTWEYDSYGNATKDTDELGHSVVKVYNEYNKVVSLTDATQRTTTYEYGLAPNSGINGAFRSTISKVTSPSGKKVEMTYDASERLLSQTIGAGVVGAMSRSYSYDAVGRPTSMNDGAGHTVNYPSDSLGRVTSLSSTVGQATAYSSDAVGKTTAVSLPSGSQVSYSYDSLDRRTGVVDGNNHTIGLNYEVGGDPKSTGLTDPKSNAYTSTRDYNGNNLSFVFPDSSQETFQHDAVGNQTSKATGSGAVCSNTYDNRNRLVSTSWNDGVTPTVTRSYDLVGNITAIDNGTSQIGFAYDNANRMISQTQTTAGDPAGSQTFTYTYNADGNRAGVTYPSGTSIAYARDGSDRISSISVNGQTTASYSYDGSGQRTEMQLSNGTHTAYSYDSAGLSSGIVTTNAAGSTVSSFNYAHDSVGNITSVQHEDGKGNYYQYDGGNQLVNAGYDAINVTTSTPSQPQLSVAYMHDPSGNWSNLTASAGPGVSVSHGLATAPTNVYVSDQMSRSGSTPVTLAMHSDGNLNTSQMYSPMSPGTGFMPGPSTGVSLSMAYGGNNAPSTLVATYSGGGPQTNGLNGGQTNITTLPPHPARTSTLEMQYDGLGRCVSQTLDGITTFKHYDGDYVVSENDDADGSLNAEYVLGSQPSEMLQVSNVNGTMFYHRDAQGSVTHLTNAQGVVVEHYKYDAYGSLRDIKDSSGASITESAVGNHFLFAGHERLPLGDLYNMGRRVYSPVVGRFNQPDPIKFRGGDANIHRYVNNNPVSFVDHTGLDGVPLDGGGISIKSEAILIPISLKDLGLQTLMRDILSNALQGDSTSRARRLAGRFTMSLPPKIGGRAIPLVLAQSLELWLELVGKVTTTRAGRLAIILLA